MNLAGFLQQAGAGRADAVALRGPRGDTTFGALADASARLAGALLAAGLAPGDRVAVVSPNTEAFVVAYLAVLHAGGVCVPLNPAAPPAALDQELELVAPRRVLVAGSAGPVVGAAGRDALTVDLDALAGEPAPVATRQPEDLAVLLFTSGTAGAPHAAMLSHGNLAANIEQVQGHPGLAVRADDVTLAALPFFHIFGLNVILGVALAAGATTVLVDRVQPRVAARAVREQAVTVLAAVPTLFADWLELGDDDAPAGSFSSVRLAVSGAAALPDAVAAAFRSRFGVVLHQGYGLTEASPIVSTTALGPSPPRPGSIGRPLPGVEVRLVDRDGSDVLLGDPGEIWVRGPNVFRGYWRDDAATAEVLVDGTLRTGDVAVLDEEGDLRLVDRHKDLIIVSGFNVYPVEVEDVLRTHPDVHDVGVAGAPSRRTGEAVVAFVVPEPGRRPDDAALLAHCARALPRYKCPTRIELVDALPRNPAGKLLRRELPV